VYVLQSAHVPCFFFFFGLIISRAFCHTASNRSMGPLIVAMPRNRYQGAFSGTTSCSNNSNSSGSMESLASSKLIGGSGSDEQGCEDEETIARQMASRLSHRLGVSVLISCNFQDNNSSSNILSQGLDRDMLQHRAAALAEREIYQLLKDKNLAS
jgi:Proteasome assembly chaperone 4